MIARVTLEIALRREFDYAIPAELAAQVEVGSRVKVPFGPRQVLGVVTAVIEESTHTNLRAILKVVGRQTLVTPEVLRLARWIGGYYCCAPETALRSVLPDAVRKEEEGWKERLHVRALPVPAEPPKLTKRQEEIWKLVQERRALPLQELLTLTGSTAETVRKLEDKGLVDISAQISERDPYAHETIVATQPLTLNAEQSTALAKITAAMDGAPQRAAGIVPADPSLFPPDRSPFFKPASATVKYSGWLPHWQQASRLYFVTFRLHDSIAQDRLRAWSAERDAWKRHHPEPWDEKARSEHQRRFGNVLERWLDESLGGCALRHPEVADAVEAALKYFDGTRYQLGEYVIMPNHVHVLVRPAANETLDAILHSWKSFTAKKANAILDATGAFWRDESFDHLVRSEAQFEKFRQYIRDNPGKAGLKEGFRLGRGSFLTPAEMQAARESQNCRHDAGSTSRGAAGIVPADPSSSSSRTFLLHGVTGSGKTEIYLQAIAHALRQGRGAIVLVPEISLTPQTVERFKARFSSGPLKTLVAVLHSHLSAGERHDEWHKIRQGRARIVIGARSAIFAPVSPLGLIIVDEEHEHSYKQEEAPRYHARDVAVVRGQMEGATVVLGSATPSMESFHNARRGKYTLLEMPSRIDDRKMPVVRVIDMRQEGRKDKGTPIFSQKLKDAILTRLEKREQVILFLNRRGYATSLQCPKCGYVAECPNCSVSLTYHRRAQKLCCHICGHEAKAPNVCPEPKCRNPEIRYAGLGTEKLEDTLVKLFPKARIARMDSDLMKRKEDYRRVLGEFKTGKVDILVGTQMIAKGLHFENVTLVGVIYADLSLHVPDFRAGERTFQLLTQVAGRAGRGDVEGEVIVQAFTPFHPAIQFARRHDYEGFYDQEIEFRQQLNYPPHSRIALLTLRGRNEEKVKAGAEHLRAEVEKLLSGKSAEAKQSGGEQLSLIGRAAETETTADEETKPPTDMQISGPAPAPLARAETYYRYQLMLRSRQMTRLSRSLEGLLVKLELPEDVSLSVDVDPVSLT